MSRPLGSSIKETAEESSCIRSLFCVNPPTHSSGGTNILLALAEMLRQTGQHVDVFFWDTSIEFGGPPGWWHKLEFPVYMGTDLQITNLETYDVVYCSHAMFLPLLLPLLHKIQKRVVPVYFTQDYESFWVGNTYMESQQECTAYLRLLALPVPLIVTSRGLQSLFRTRAGRESLWVPVFPSNIVSARDTKRSAAQDSVCKTGYRDQKRILMIGNYLLPFKGMQDGFDAIQLLSTQLDVQLLLVTRETRLRSIFDKYSFPIEFINSPDDALLSEIYASSDVFCCSSWYEGFGLPALEAFSHAVPVVSTSHAGVADYGIDGENLLLANPNDPLDLSNKLSRVLLEEQLAQRLCASAQPIAERFNSASTLKEFLHCQTRLLESDFALPHIDEHLCAELMEDLERQGLHTPPMVAGEFSTIESTLRSILDCIAAGEAPESFESSMKELRNTIQKHLRFKSSAYYIQFKSRYDLCELLLSLWNDKRLITVARRLSSDYGAAR